jgi:hypothetical protein
MWNVPSGTTDRTSRFFTRAAAALAEPLKTNPWRA